MKTILAVDDNQDDLFLLERTLAVAGVEHRLLTAGDGVEAEELLENIEGGGTANFPSLVFLDVNMPHRNGFAFLDWFKRKPRCAKIPVVMLSSFDDPAEMDKAFALGAAECLQKPPAPRAVRRLMQTLTGGSSKGIEDDGLEEDGGTSTAVPIKIAVRWRPEESELPSRLRRPRREQQAPEKVELAPSQLQAVLVNHRAPRNAAEVVSASGES